VTAAAGDGGEGPGEEAQEAPKGEEQEDEDEAGFSKVTGIGWRVRGRWSRGEVWSQAADHAYRQAGFSPR